MVWDDKPDEVLITSAKINGRRGIKPTKLNATKVVTALNIGFSFFFSNRPVFFPQQNICPNFSIGNYNVCDFF